MRAFTDGAFGDLQFVKISAFRGGGDVQVVLGGAFRCCVISTERNNDANNIRQSPCGNHLSFRGRGVLLSAVDVMCVARALKREVSDYALRLNT
jgi:hypothetical protein